MGDRASLMARWLDHWRRVEPLWGHGPVEQLARAMFQDPAVEAVRVYAGSATKADDPHRLLTREMLASGEQRYVMPPLTNRPHSEWPGWRAIDDLCERNLGLLDRTALAAVEAFRSEWNREWNRASRWVDIPACRVLLVPIAEYSDPSRWRHLNENGDEITATAPLTPGSRQIHRSERLRDGRVFRLAEWGDVEADAGDAVMALLEV